MRQAQQNRRGRGRNRKGQNPLTRTYESNGPDVKIRGTPSHIAEKYVSMARDALSSGDPVLAENYLQHAEHYNRIIMAHREQQMSEEGRASGQGNGRGKAGHDLGDDDGGDDGDPLGGEAPSAHSSRGDEQQPRAGRGEQGDEARSQRRGRNRGDDGDRGDRSERGERSERGDRSDRGEGGGSRANGRSGRRTRYAENDDQPDFLKRPVRRRSEDDGEEAAEASMEADQAAE